MQGQQNIRYSKIQRQRKYINLIASWEVGVEVNAGETKYWFTLLHQNVGQNRYIGTAKMNSFEMLQTLNTNSP